MIKSILMLTLAAMLGGPVLAAGKSTKPPAKAGAAASKSRSKSKSKSGTKKRSRKRKSSTRPS